MLKCYVMSANVIMATRGNSLYLGLWISYDFEHFVRDGALGEHVFMD